MRIDLRLETPREAPLKRDTVLALGFLSVHPKPNAQFNDSIHTFLVEIVLDRLNSGRRSGINTKKRIAPTNVESTTTRLNKSNV